MIRILIVDDHLVVADGLRCLLARQKDMEVIGCVTSGLEAVERAQGERPEVVLMDFRMPGLDGIEATRRIAADPGPACVRVLILTNFGLDSYVFAALRAGASGFLLKDADPADLLRMVAVVARGDALLAPAVTRTLISEFVTAPAPADPAAGRDLLTAREQEIAELVARGLSNRDIAATLTVTEGSAANYVQRILTKLGFRSRAQIAVWAVQLGLAAQSAADLV